MKYLLVIVVVWVAYMVWRAQRRKDLGNQAPGTKAGKPDQISQDMVQCPVCALHLPRGDALPGTRALYCSDEHRRAAED